MNRDFDAEIRRIERLRVTSMWVSRVCLVLGAIGGWVVLKWTWFTLWNVVHFIAWCKSPAIATVSILALVFIFGGLSYGTWVVYRDK